MYNYGNSKGGRCDEKAIVIGAGLDGLSAAITMQAKGADVTIVTATRRLIEERDRPSYPDKKLDRFESSISAFVILAGKKERLTHLPHHQVMFTNDYQAKFRQIFHEKRMPDDPTIHISHSAATDPDVTDGSNLFILVNAPAADVDTERYKEIIYERLFSYGIDVGISDYEQIIAPRDIARRFSA
ncbi:phytoene desaturase family protein [Domibacillus tundrae]|uniref:phytoene desaturase family protein n=1 Tax=Domibacillus tundrae TaxID=1587527 RepID=UPI00339571F3